MDIITLLTLSRKHYQRWQIFQGYLCNKRGSFCNLVDFMDDRQQGLFHARITATGRMDSDAPKMQSKRPIIILELLIVFSFCIAHPFFQALR